MEKMPRPQEEFERYPSFPLSEGQQEKYIEEAQSFPEQQKFVVGISLEKQAKVAEEMADLGRRIKYYKELLSSGRRADFVLREYEDPDISYGVMYRLTLGGAEKIYSSKEESRAGEVKITAWRTHNKDYGLLYIESRAYGDKTTIKIRMGKPAEKFLKSLGDKNKEAA